MEPQIIDLQKSNLRVDLSLDELLRRYFDMDTDEVFDYFFEVRHFFHTHSTDRQSFYRLYDEFTRALDRMDKENGGRFNLFMIEDESLRTLLIETMYNDRHILESIEFCRIVESSDRFHHPDHPLHREEYSRLRVQAKQTIKELEERQS